MFPTLIMLTMYLLAAGGMYYFMKNAGKLETPFDLVIGFFTVCLLFMLTFQWYAGWPDHYNGVYFTITNYYMAGFTGLVAIVMLFILIGYGYKFIFYESRDVTV
jgi:hypothetical protein